MASLFCGDSASAWKWENSWITQYSHVINVWAHRYSKDNWRSLAITSRNFYNITWNLQTVRAWRLSLRSRRCPWMRLGSLIRRVTSYNWQTKQVPHQAGPALRWDLTPHERQTNSHSHILPMFSHPCCTPVYIRPDKKVCTAEHLGSFRIYVLQHCTVTIRLKGQGNSGHQVSRETL